MNDRTASLRSPPTPNADLQKDTKTLDMLAALFDPQVVSEFLKNTKHVQNQEEQKDDVVERKMMMNKALWILPVLALASCVSSQELEECQQNVKTLQQSQRVLQKDLNDLKAVSQEQQEQMFHDQETITNLTTMIEKQRQKIMSLKPQKKARKNKRK